jgi:hypothetical protein
VFARLAKELSRQRPDLPILVIESRGTAGWLGSVALAGGFALRRHENIMVSSAVPQPKDIYTPTRILVCLPNAAKRQAASCRRRC